MHLREYGVDRGSHKPDKARASHHNSARATAYVGFRTFVGTYPPLDTASSSAGRKVKKCSISTVDKFGGINCAPRYWRSHCDIGFHPQFDAAL